MAQNDAATVAEDDLLSDLIGQIALGMWSEMNTIDRALEWAEENRNSASVVEQSYISTLGKP
jgi:hypothetical protein